MQTSRKLLDIARQYFKPSIPLRAQLMTEDDIFYVTDASMRLAVSNELTVFRVQYLENVTSCDLFIYSKARHIYKRLPLSSEVYVEWRVLYSVAKLQEALDKTQYSAALFVRGEKSCTLIGVDVFKLLNFATVRGRVFVGRLGISEKSAPLLVLEDTKHALYIACSPIDDCFLLEKAQQISTP